MTCTILYADRSVEERLLTMRPPSWFTARTANSGKKAAESDGSELSALACSGGDGRRSAVTTAGLGVARLRCLFGMAAFCEGDGRNA